MKNLLILLAVGATLAAAPVLAQDRPATGAAQPGSVDMSKMSDAEMHAHCKEVMGHRMDGRVPHDHSVDKMGHVPPHATPLSEAEMKKMHEKCAAIMASKPPTTPK